MSNAGKIIILSIIILVTYGWVGYSYLNPPPSISDNDFKILDSQFAESCPETRDDWAAFKTRVDVTDQEVAIIVNNCLQEIFNRAQKDIEQNRSKDPSPNKSKFRHGRSSSVAMNNLGVQSHDHLYIYKI